MVWLTDVRRSALFPGGTTDILTIANHRHAVNRIWTCAEPELRLCWMKMWSSDNQHRTSNPGILSLKSLSGSKVNSAFYSSGVNQIITRNIPRTFEPPHLGALFRTWANPSPLLSYPPPSPPAAQSIRPLRRYQSVTLSGCWQTHRYYIYNKYFVNKLVTVSLYQKSFININMVDKIKCIYWFNYKIVIGSQKTTSTC